MATSIHDLAFLCGQWEGEECVLHVGPPAGTMLFGFRQTVREGRTVHWETYRFALEEGRLVCHPAPLGQPAGRYDLVSRAFGSTPSVAFEDPANPRLRRLAWSTAAGGDELVLHVDDLRDGAPCRERWVLRRAASG